MEETIFSRIQQNIQKFGAKPFLRLLESNGQSGISGTYAGVVQLSLNWMQVYREKGLCPGDRVVIILPHSMDLYVSYLGAVLCGMVPTLFHFPSPKLSRSAYFETAGQLLKSADARLVVTYEELATDLREVLQEEGLEVAVCTSKDKPQGLLQELSAYAAQAGDTAFLQYSSGTTGLKKGVGISHQALLRQIDLYAQSIHLQSHDVIVSWLPLYHDMGLIACYWLPFIKGTPLIAMSPFDWVQRPGMLWEVATKQRPTLCWLPNFAYNHMVRSVSDTALSYYDLRSLRGIINCSEPILEMSHRRFIERFQPCGLNPQALWSCYAMAENTFAVTQGGAKKPLFVDCIDRLHFAKTGEALPVPKDHPHAQTLVSSGSPLPSTKVEVRDETGQRLADRRQGEIVISSPCLMKGYLGPDGEKAISDGSFATGDLGYLADGELIVTGRKKDLIIIAGKNIYPQDIENIVHEVEGIIPGRSVALGLKVEEAGTEELVVLAETHEEDASKLARMRQQIGDSIARQTEVVAHDIRLLPHRWLKKSSSGKIARAANLERYCTELSQESVEPVGCATTDEDPRISEMRQLLMEAMAPGRSKKIQNLFPEQSLIASGVLDSLSLINLMVELESRYNLRMPGNIQTDLSRFDSLQSLVSLVDDLKQRVSSKAIEEEEKGRKLSVRGRKSTDYVNGSKDFDLLIVGSSRVDGFSSKIAQKQGYKAFNFSVNSAQAEDWYCITRLVTEYTQVPIRRILLGIDIEGFNGLHSPDQRLVDCPLLRSYLEKEDVKEIEELFPADKGLNQIVSTLSKEKRQRFQTVFTHLRQQQATQARDFDYDPYTGDLLFKEQGVFKLAYEKRLSLCIEGLEKMEDLGSQQRATEMRLQKFDRLFERRVRYFEHVIALCEQKKIDLTCFLTPMHPLLKELLVKRTSYQARVDELKELFASLIAPHCTLIDCSEPELFGGNHHDFRDEVHIGPYNSDKLLEHLLSQPRVLYTERSSRHG